MPLTRQQRIALDGLLKTLFAGLLLAFILWAVVSTSGCTRKIEPIAVYTETSDLAASIAAQLEAREDGKVYHLLPTGSMEPTLHGGDWLVAVKTPFPELQIGMVVNYYPEWQPGTLTAHRIVAAWPDGSWLMEGDSPRNAPENKSRLTARNYIDHIVSVHRAK